MKGSAVCLQGIAVMRAIDRVWVDYHGLTDLAPFDGRLRWIDLETHALISDIFYTKLYHVCDAPVQ